MMSRGEGPISVLLSGFQSITVLVGVPLNWFGQHLSIITDFWKLDDAKSFFPQRSNVLDNDQAENHRDAYPRSVGSLRCYTIIYFFSDKHYV